MLRCRFLNIFRFAFLPGSVLLSGILFSGIVAPVVSAQVVQAYRKPSEADLQWLFDGQPTLKPISSVVVQTGFSREHCEPCEPVGLPTPPIPPAPKVSGGLSPAGIAPPAESTVTQVSGRRLPPPPNVPKEPDMLTAPSIETVIERLPKPEEQNVFDHSRHSIVIPGDEDLTCQTYSRQENIFSVPEMIGGCSWLPDGKIGIDTDQWTLPVMLLSRPNITEHFNAGVQNRIWADYRQWENAVSIVRNNVTEPRSIEQFTFGLEKSVLENTSLELRVPILGNDTATAEPGNLSVFFKQVLKQNARWTLSGGVGMTIPTAEDGQFNANRLNNKTYYLVPFLGVQWHPNKKTFGHFVVQADVPIEKNEWVCGSDRFSIEGQKMIRTGIQLGRWYYRNDFGTHPCRLGGFMEIDYAVVTEGTFEGLPYDKTALTTALGIPMVFGNLTCTNSVALPISGGNDPYGIGYNFSLNLQF